MKMSPARRVLFALALVAGRPRPRRRCSTASTPTWIPIDPIVLRVPLPAPDWPRGHGLADPLACRPRPARAPRGLRAPVAQERPRDRPRHPAGDAAARPLLERRPRGLRRDAPGQHRRRRLLRHPAPARRPRGRRAGRRRRQGQPGGAADGPAARHAAHAARRGPRRRRRSSSASTSRSRATRPRRASSRCCSSPSTRPPAIWCPSTRATCRGSSGAATATSTASPRAASPWACSTARATRPRRTRLEPGDLLVLYSDGITEAESPSGVPFDEEGLVALIRAHAGNPDLRDDRRGHHQGRRAPRAGRALRGRPDGAAGATRTERRPTRDSGLGPRARTVCRRFRSHGAGVKRGLRRNCDRAPSPEPRIPDSRSGRAGVLTVMSRVPGRSSRSCVLALAGRGRRPPQQTPPVDGIVRLLLRHRAVDAGRQARRLPGPAVGRGRPRVRAQDASRALIVPGHHARGHPRARSDAARGHAARRRLPPDGRGPHRARHRGPASRPGASTSAACPPTRARTSGAIAGQQQLTTIDGLYRLSLNPSKAVPRAQSRGPVRRPRDPPCRRLRLRRRNARRAHRRGAARRSTAATCRSGPRPRPSASRCASTPEATASRRRDDEAFLRFSPSDFRDAAPGRALTPRPRRTRRCSAAPTRCSGRRSASRSASTSAISAARRGRCRRRRATCSPRSARAASRR